MSNYLDEIVASRPELAPETPFAAIIDALADATVAVAKVVDLVSFDPADLRDEFPLRTYAEQTAFGVQVAVASMTLQALAQEAAGAVAGIFEEFRGQSAGTGEEPLKVESERDHELSKDCWCGPEVETPGAGG